MTWPSVLKESVWHQPPAGLLRCGKQLNGPRNRLWPSPRLLLKVSEPSGDFGLNTYNGNLAAGNVAGPGPRARARLLAGGLRLTGCSLVFSLARQALSSAKSSSVMRDLSSSISSSVTRRTMRGTARKDPYVTSGLVTRWEVRSWAVVIGDGAADASAKAV